MRFQEHLAACELARRRGLSLVPLVEDAGWQGVFELFAAVNDNLLWFAQWLRDNGQGALLTSKLTMTCRAAKPSERGALVRIANGDPNEE